MAGRIFAWRFDGSASDYVSVRSFLKRHRFPNALLSSLKAIPDAVLADGQPIHLNAVLKGGEILSVRLPEETLSDRIAPENIPLDILYEDADLLVVNKPSGMPVHSSAGHVAGTLANAVAFHYEEQRRAAGGRSGPRQTCADRCSGPRQTCADRCSDSRQTCAGGSGDSVLRSLPFSGWEHYTPAFHCLNRLDRDTTGVIVIAKHRLAAANLGAAAEKRRVHRTYIAVVKGETAPHGVITEPIGRVPGSVILRQVTPDGQSARTEYWRIGIYRPGNGFERDAGPGPESGPEWDAGPGSGSRPEGDAGSDPESGTKEEVYSVLRISLGTGRTHQIRVHMKAAGHPLPGDYLYEPDYRRIGRQPLHSYRMTFVHPVTGGEVTFTAPVPEDMRAAFGLPAYPLRETF